VNVCARARVRERGGGEEGMRGRAGERERGREGERRYAHGFLVKSSL
jgi:hypothetical protein